MGNHLGRRGNVGRTKAETPGAASPLYRYQGDEDVGQMYPRPAGVRRFAILAFVALRGGSRSPSMPGGLGATASNASSDFHWRAEELSLCSENCLFVIDHFWSSIRGASCACSKGAHHQESDA